MTAPVWKKVGDGRYETTDRDGLRVVARRQGSWWLKQCGTVVVRYETLRSLKASVR